MEIGNKETIIELLLSRGKEQQDLLNASRKCKEKHVGRKVYLRALIEYSNRCKKSCYYCGIRAGNKEVHRYKVKKNEVLEAAKFAYQNGFGSMVLQAGECNDQKYITEIEEILYTIQEFSQGELGVTLSLGEQSRETYKRWRAAGAKRYLLRIETSNPKLYAKLHPKGHLYEKRIDCLSVLKELDFQVGSGVMIGLPFQKVSDLADDLLFFKKIGIDMVGMGPYLEHKDTPLYTHRNLLLPPQERYSLSLNMLAVLRLLML